MIPSITHLHNSIVTYRHIRRDRFAPNDRAGYLYYVRLQTSVGSLYKIGFTKLASAEDRLKFNGAGDEKLIESVLLFIHLDNAYSIEQQLHSSFSNARAFGKFARYPYMPLFQNGQSELYVEDVLKLDESFEISNVKQTRKRIKEIHSKQKHESSIRIYFETRGIELLAKVIGILLIPVLFPLLWLLGHLYKEEEAAFLVSQRKSKQELNDLLTFLAKEKQRQI